MVDAQALVYQPMSVGLLNWFVICTVSRAADLRTHLRSGRAENRLAEAVSVVAR